MVVVEGLVTEFILIVTLLAAANTVVRVAVK